MLLITLDRISSYINLERTYFGHECFFQLTLLSSDMACDSLRMQEVK